MICAYFEDSRCHHCHSPMTPPPPNHFLLQQNTECYETSVNADQSTSSGHTTSPSQHVWLLGFCCGDGPTVWNSLPDNLRDPDVTIDNFKRLLKTVFFLFSPYQCNLRIKCVMTMNSINLHFAYLLTYKVS